MSLILDTLRGRKPPTDVRLRPRDGKVAAAAGPDPPGDRGPARTPGDLVLYVLFLVILGVCGWVLAL